jgi:hypothetical protein
LCQVLVALPCVLRTEVGSDSAALNTALSQVGQGGACNHTIVFTSDGAALRCAYTIH